MIRRPPRSTLFPYHDALPISSTASPFFAAGAAATRAADAGACTTAAAFDGARRTRLDRKSTRLNSSHSQISYAVFCLKKKKTKTHLPYTPPQHIHNYSYLSTT